MRKILSIFLLVLLVWFGLVSFNSCDKGVEAVSAALSDGSVTYLVCGFDSASKNTDSILLVNYTFSDNSVSFVQIPRDTYYSYNGRTKINAIYPDLIASGVDETEAMERLVRVISRTFSIKIDGYIGLSTEAVASFIDNIGGITLDIPFDMRFENSSGEVTLFLKAGKNHISGKEAILFIRARNMYAMGDIARIDAQKFFISSFLEKVKNELSVSDIISSITKLQEETVNNHDIGGIIKILIKNRGRLGNISAKYANIPGAVVQSSDGVWYYSVAKYGANKLLDAMGFARYGEMDPNKSLLNRENEEFARIYESSEYNVVIYDDTTLPKLEIREK